MTLPYLSQAAEDAGRFATVDSATWLTQADAAAWGEFDQLRAARDYRAAYDLLGAHLARTEANRRRVHGPAPDLQAAYAGYLVAWELEAAYADVLRVQRLRRGAAVVGVAS